MAGNNKVIVNNDKVIIGRGKQKEKGKLKKDAISNTFNEDELAGQESSQPDQEPEKELLDVNVWDNDNSILNKLTESQLAERRLYVRAAYMQEIECYIVLDSLGEEPVPLIRPIKFMVIDISMGGIGIVCDYEIDIGKILVFKFSLDNMEYEIKCEVVYCFPNEGKYRAGLKLVEKDKQFIKHLKIVVARISLKRTYDINTEYNPEDL